MALQFETIDPPHGDVELSFPREPLDYAVSIPAAGLTDDTGLVFFIPGFGMYFDEDYPLRLIEWLSATQDCVAVCVGYHGAKGMSRDTADIVPAADFFLKMKAHYGISVTAPQSMAPYAIAMNLLTAMQERGLTALHPECHFVRGVRGYMNFGVLSALDHLQVMGRLLARLPINRRRTIAIGTSYGGYVALMLAKMAPDTFRLIIDNSGFSGAECLNIYGEASLGEPLPIRVLTPFAFSRDPSAPTFFDPSHRLIREIGVEAHYPDPSLTVIHSYHAAGDAIASTDRKIQALDILGRRRRCDLRVIHSADLDGRIFKDLSHGMAASMRGLFDLSYRRWREEGGITPDLTDFDQGTRTRLVCADRTYVVDLSPGGEVSLSVESARPSTPQLDLE